MAAKAKAVAECHLDIVLLLVARHNSHGVNTILGVLKVDGGVHPACKAEHKDLRFRQGIYIYNSGLILQTDIILASRLLNV